mmetsp:Transcript_24514/g.36060  ORF Transcript_24514/g.36060 Transcript_24514/m.36060 type:complete len:433 (+) Transcript_24514:51-1349(+)
MAAEEDFIDDDLPEENDIQLGFIEEATNPLFNDSNWKNWDGGKVGGKPIWLNRDTLPSYGDIQCSSCKETMALLVQIYCPLDQPDTAFHRSLYLFCCRKAECIDSGSIKCIRCQLPRVNKFYPPIAPDESESESVCVPVGSYPNLCAVCGCHGSHCCGKCRNVFYCSRSHQKLHWRHHKSACGTGEVDSSAPSSGALFPEYEIAIEPEEVPADHDNQTSSDQQPTTENDLLKGLDPRTEVWEGAVTPGGEGEEADAALRQADYNAALGNKEGLTDPVYVKFLTRVSLGGNDQVLRYYCGPRGMKDVSTTEGSSSRLPLPVSSIGTVDEESVPVCERCGAARTFEFQVMPQLLHFLNIDHNTRLKSKSKEKEEQEGDKAAALASEEAFENTTREDIDWGSLDVFTCSMSCTLDDPNPYAIEYVWKQPSPMKVK